MAEQSPEALLGSRDWLDRQLAIQTIEKKQDTSAVPSLSEVLRTDNNMYVRLAAARVLGKLGDASSVQALVEAFNNDDYPMVRQSAMWSLGEVAERDPQTTGNVLPVLQQALQDESFLAERDLQITRLAKISLDRISKVVGADLSQLAAVDGMSTNTSTGPKVIEVDITDKHRAKLEAAATRRADIAPYVPAKDTADDTTEGGSQPGSLEELLANIGASTTDTEAAAAPQKVIEVNITDEHRAKLEAAAKRRAKATA